MRVVATLGVTLVACAWTTLGRAAFTDAEQPDHAIDGSHPSSGYELPRFDIGACYVQTGRQLAPLAAAGYDAWLGDSSRLRLEGGCNVARTPLGAIALRGSVATMQPLSQADAQGIVSTLSAHRYFGFALGPVGARAEAAVQYTNLNLGPTGFGEVYSLDSGVLTNAGRGVEVGLRYRANYGESHLAAPAANPPGSWLHQFYATSNWNAPVRHGVLTVGASAGYLVDRVANINQNGGWQVALSAQYPVSPRLKLTAGSGYNDREYRPYVTRDVILLDRPENTWSCNLGVSYSASSRTSMRLEWVGSAPASELKALSHENSNLLFSISTSY